MKDFKDKKPKFKNCLFYGSLVRNKCQQINLKENDFDVLEFNASEMRNQKLIEIS